MSMFDNLFTSRVFGGRATPQAPGGTPPFLPTPTGAPQVPAVQVPGLDRQPQQQQAPGANGMEQYTSPAAVLSLIASAPKSTQQKLLSGLFGAQIPQQAPDDPRLGQLDRSIATTDGTNAAEDWTQQGG